MEDRWDKIAREQHIIQGSKDTVTISKAEYETLKAGSTQAMSEKTRQAIKTAIAVLSERERQLEAKASKYDKLFEGLRAEDKCGCTVTITSAKAFCSFCNGTGKILRELTEEEKEEFFKIAIKTRLEEYYTATYLNSGAKVLRI